MKEPARSFPAALQKICLDQTTDPGLGTRDSGPGNRLGALRADMGDGFYLYEHLRGA